MSLIYAACQWQKTANAALTSELKRSNTYAQTIIIVFVLVYIFFVSNSDSMHRGTRSKNVEFPGKSVRLAGTIHIDRSYHCYICASFFLLNRLCPNQVENGCNEPRILTKNSFASFNIYKTLRRRCAGTKCLRDDAVLR